MEQGDKTVSSKMDTKIFKMFSIEKMRNYIINSIKVLHKTKLKWMRKFQHEESTIHLPIPMDN